MERNRTWTIGIWICAFLGVVDIASIATLGADDAPPLAVSVACLGLGVATLVGVWRIRTRRSPGPTTVAVSRVASGLLSIPAFFVDDAPEGAAVFARSSWS